MRQEKGATPPFAKKQEYSRAYRVAYTAALATGGDTAGAAVAGWAAVRTDAKGAGYGGGGASAAGGGGGGSKADDDDGAILLSDDSDEDGLPKRMRREEAPGAGAISAEAAADGAVAAGGGGADAAAEADPFAGWDDPPLPAAGTSEAPIELF
jgi:hypothetical protein